MNEQSNAKKNKSYSGSRWYKCDLHLHTMTSPCYLDRTDTPAEWVARAIEQGLHAVAVTDHNDYRGIRDIMAECREQGLAVFPGVEITCDSSKIHMLILFDTCKNEETVRDFLNRCDIDSESVGDAGGTTLSVTEVCQIAKRRGAMVIAAHIDEFSSISSMNPASLDKLLGSGLIDAVQVANVPIWERYKQDKDAESMYATMREKYGPDATPEMVERFRKCYDRALEAGLPMLAFSDNPHAANESKHGLWGIGSVYTWIQMDDDVDLESLRQSLISPANRIRTCFDSPQEPKAEPDFWIRSLEVRRSALNPHQPIHLDFNPQLNCIIGGRGSGKSSIIRILKAVYRQISGDGADASIYDIFTEESEVEIYFNWYGNAYRMLVSDFAGEGHSKYAFYRIDSENGTEEKDETWDDQLFRVFMSAQVFAHREINGIACDSQELLGYIDSLIKDMYIMKAQRDYCIDRLVQCAQNRDAERRLLDHTYQVAAELTWLKSLEGLKELPAAIRDDYPQMIALRSQTIEELDGGMDRLNAIKKEQAGLMSDYEKIIEQIYNLRAEYIARVFGDDENYKIELQHMGDRDSLRRMMETYLGVDISLIRDDVSKLENAIYDKKGSLQQYQTLIRNARRLARGEKTDGPVDFSDYFIHKIGELSLPDFEHVRLFHPEDLLCLFYHPTGVKRYFLMEHASSGERAAAMFSFFLQSKESPLVIDMPETDIDNHVLYEEILPKIKKAKQNRQLIMATHNPILATNADAGMIIAMESGSKFVRVRSQGTLDSSQTRKDVCDIIEGSAYAFRQRAKKYNID